MLYIYVMVLLSSVTNSPKQTVNLEFHLDLRLSFQSYLRIISI